MIDADSEHFGTEDESDQLGIDSWHQNVPVVAWEYIGFANSAGLK
jgi:hypothetical protein